MTSPLSLLPPNRQPICDRSFKIAIEAVSEAGLAEMVDAWIAETKRGIGGRPVAVTTKAVLVALYLTVTDDRAALVTEMAGVLSRLNETQRQVLGIRADLPDPDEVSPKARRSRDAFYKANRMALKRVTDIVEPVPFPKNRRMLKVEWRGRNDNVDPAEFELRRNRLSQLDNAIVRMSFRSMNRKMRRAWKGSQVVDGTKIPSCARGVANSDEWMSSDPTASFHVREGDHADPDSDTATGLPIKTTSRRNPAARKHKSSGYTYAHEATFAVMTSDNPKDDRTFPFLVAGVSFDRPGHDPAGNALRAMLPVDSGDGQRPWLAGDLAYLPNSKPENFQIPLRELGFEPVFDYRSDQLGIQESYAGAIQVDGNWYCPAMPQPLVTATFDVRSHTIDESTWRQRIAGRNQYRIRATGAGSKSGAVAMRCPAASPAPTVRCPLKPRSLNAKKGLRTILDRPSCPDRICTNTKTVNFPANVGIKYAQKLAHGSPECQSTYNFMRSVVESANAFVKDGAFEGLGDPTRRRVRGLAGQSILCSFLVFAANIRKIRSFYEKADERPDGTFALPPSKKRIDYFAIAYRPSGTDPPDRTRAA